MLTRRLAIVLVALALVVPIASVTAGPAADQIALLEDRLAAVEARVTALESAPPSSGTAPYDIRAYGATTASADNATAINAAISAANAAGGGEVFVPPGTWTHGGVTLKSNVTLAGEGWASVLRLKDGANAHNILLQASASHIGVRDLRIDGNKAAQTEGSWSYGVVSGTGGVSDAVVEGIWVEHTLRSGVYLEGLRNAVLHSHMDDIGNTTDPGRTCVVVSGETVPGGFSRVIGNRLNDCTEYGIKVYPNSDHTAVSDNIITGSGRYGIYVQSSDRVALTGNVVKGSGDSGILIQGTDNGNSSIGASITGGSVTGSTLNGIFLWAGNGGTVTDTVISGVAIDGNVGPGIAINSAQNTTITGVSVTNNATVFPTGSAGINLGPNSTNTTITGSLIRNNGNSTYHGVGIWSYGTNVEITITGNRIFNTGSGHQKIGVQSQVASDYWTVTGNDLRGNLTSGLSLVGANNLVSNNQGYP